MIESFGEKRKPDPAEAFPFDALKDRTLQYLETFAKEKNLPKERVEQLATLIANEPTPVGYDGDNKLALSAFAENILGLFPDDGSNENTLIRIFASQLNSNVQ